MKQILIKNQQDTRQFGRRLGESATPGTIIAMIGDLGTGKTTLSKAIAEGLGVQELITSPTFAIVQQYDSGRLPFYHFDVYRIGDSEEMYELGYEEYFFGQGVTVVEWADQIMSLIPKGTLTIHLTYGDNLENPEERIYNIEYKE